MFASSEADPSHSSGPPAPPFRLAAILLVVGGVAFFMALAVRLGAFEPLQGLSFGTRIRLQAGVLLAVPSVPLLALAALVLLWLDPDRYSAQWRLVTTGAAVLAGMFVVAIVLTTGLTVFAEADRFSDSVIPPGGKFATVMSAIAPLLVSVAGLVLGASMLATPRMESGLLPPEPVDMEP